MDRQEELQNMMNCTEELPERLNMNMLQKRVKKRAFVHHVVMTCRNTVGVFAGLILCLAIAVNTSPTFAKEIEDVAVIGKVAKWLCFSNKGYEESVSADYVTESNISVKGKCVQMEVPYVLADDRRLVLVHHLQQLDPQKKYYVMIDQVVDADDRETIENWGGRVYEDGDNEVCEILWEEFHQNLEVTIGVYEMETNVHVEDLKWNLNVGEKMAYREYMANANVEQNGIGYCISKVRMYPLSTEIDIRPMKEEDYDDYGEQTVYMRFYLTDGEKVLQSDIGNEYMMQDEGFSTYGIEGGYFSMKEQEIRLGISAIYQLPINKKYVSFDIEKGCFFDESGVDKNLQIVESPDHDYIAVRLVGMDEYMEYMEYNSFIWSQNSDLDEQMYIDWIDIKGHQVPVMFLKKSALEAHAEDGIVEFVREYPTDVIRFGEGMENPTFEIPLTLY